MKRIRGNYRAFLRKEYVWPTVVAVALLAGSLVANYFAGIYAVRTASNSVSDIILSNTRAYDVDFFFVWGAIGMWAFFALLCLADPKKIPFSLKAIALFVVIRAIFISLTHIAPFPNEAVIDSGPKLFNILGFDDGLFFSGHTGLPFLMALVFWKDKFLRWFFIAASVFFAAIVLLGHLHYTIDVFAAFFITYTIYKIAEHFFPRDREFFYSGPADETGRELFSERR